MVKTTLAIFEANDETYIQSIDLSADKVTIHDVDKNVILEIDHRGRMSDRSGAVGDFHIEKVEGVDYWVYYENPLRTRIVCGPFAPSDSVLHAEVLIAKRYIKRKAMECEVLHPAPFRFDGHGINDANGQRLAKVSFDPYPGGSQRDPEYDRLSLLFTAAPELLSALESIVLMYEADPDDLETMDAGIKIANAAIKKAKGLA